jgi:hypothetical protein
MSETTLTDLVHKHVSISSYCDTLHLGNQNLHQLDSSLSSFASLKSIWLNGNKLQSLAGLECSIQLKSLYLHNNKLSDLSEGVIRQLKYLEELTLHDNQLQSLNEVLTELTYLKHLSFLNIYNNPCEQEDNYRLAVIGALPQLQYLDRHRITEDERKNAKSFKKRIQTVQTMLLRGNGTSSAKIYEDEETIKARNSLKKNLIKRVKSFLKSKKVYLDQLLQPYDLQNNGIIGTDHFWSILKEYGISDDFHEDEVRYIEKEYQTFSSKSRVLSSTMMSAIDYRKFCGDFIPRSMQLSQVERKSKHDEISATTRSLIRYVKNFETMRQVNTDTLLSNQLTSLDQSQDIALPAFRRQQPATNSVVDPWLMHEISKIITPYDGKLLQLQDVENIYLKIKELGKEPSLSPDEVMLHLSYTSNDPSAAITTRALRKAFGCLKKFEPTIKTDSNELRISLRNATAVTTASISNQSFQQASHLLNDILHNGNDPNTSSLAEKALAYSITGTRLMKQSTDNMVFQNSQVGNHLLRYDTLSIPNFHARCTTSIGFNESEWRQQLLGLGLQGELLELAINRKKRTAMVKHMYALDQQQGPRIPQSKHQDMKYSLPVRNKLQEDSTNARSKVEFKFNSSYETSKTLRNMNALNQTN